MTENTYNSLRGAIAALARQVDRAYQGNDKAELHHASDTARRIETLLAKGD